MLHTKNQISKYLLEHKSKKHVSLRKTIQEKDFQRKGATEKFSIRTANGNMGNRKRHQNLKNNVQRCVAVLGCLNSMDQNGCRNAMVLLSRLAKPHKTFIRNNGKIPMYIVTNGKKNLHELKMNDPSIYWQATTKLSSQCFHSTTNDLRRNPSTISGFFNELHSGGQDIRRLLYFGKLLPKIIFFEITNTQNCLEPSLVFTFSLERKHFNFHFLV